LLQTKYTVPYRSSYEDIRISCDADWGNVRYGKKFSLTRSKSFIVNLVSNAKTILDIGSNRGAFVKFVREINKECDIVAVEPDCRLIDYEKLADVYKGKFENFDYNSTFDFIYCSHTLEHADNLYVFVDKLKEVMSNETYLFLEVPNIEGISEKTLVEELFIDKHVYHFHPEVLANILEAYDFEIIDMSVNRFDMWFLLRKGNENKEGSIRVGSVVGILKNLVRGYSARLSINRDKLADAFRGLSCYNKVAFWGCSRIFDAIIKYGKFPREKIVAAVDSFLPDFVSEVSGVPISKPADVLDVKPELFIISARSFSESIRSDIVRYFGEVKTLSFTDIMMGRIK